MNPNAAKVGRQLQEIWKQLGTSQRVSVALATAVLAAAIVGVAWWSSRADYSLLYGKLSDGEAAKVIAALDDAKVPYKIGSGGSSVLVPTEKVHLMRMQLAGKGIPRSGDGVGFEIFDKPNFGISDFVQRANYIRALQGELARTIAQIDEIESARVMVVLPENRLLIDKDKHPTASVFVRLRSDQLPPAAINSIRFLVANSVEGLKPNFVSVVDNKGNVLSENVENDSLVGLTATQLDARRNLEQYLAKKTEGMLEKVLGPGQAIVRVAAEINFDTITRTEEKFDPDGQVLRTQTKDESTEDSTTAANNEVVGVSANTPGATNTTSTASTPVTNTRNKKTTGTTEYEVSKSTSSILQSAGGVKHLSAAVTVAARYEGTGAARKAVSRTPEEVEKLRRIVANVLGTDTTRGDQVTVEEMPFNDQFAADVTKTIETQERRDFWWTLAHNLAYPALAIGIILIFLRLFKRTSRDDVVIGIPLARSNHHNGNGHGNGKELSPAYNGRSDDSSEVVTVEVLNQLIKENPQNMTQAIRSWLDRGSTPSKQ